MGGLYWGPGVALCLLGSLANLDSNAIVWAGAVVLLTLSATSGLKSTSYLL